MKQCKHIQERPILEFVWDVNNQDKWANWCFGNEHDVRQAFPDGYETPDNLVLAKMRKLFDRGLIDGCSCGCRGDYHVTLKGCEFIDRPKHRRFFGDVAY